MWLDDSLKGTVFVVFGRNPMEAMVLEQEIAQSIPELQLRIESFESYDDALVYCRNHRMNGFLIVLHDNREPGIEDVFENLNAAFTDSGREAHGVIVVRPTSGTTELPIFCNSNLIAYVDRAQFRPASACKALFERLMERIPTPPLKPSRGNPYRYPL